MKKLSLFACFFILLSSFASAQLQEGPEIKLKKVSKDANYGTSPETAIKVGTVAHEYDYLAMLAGPNGEKITYKRIKSCCPFDCDSAPLGTGLLDKWEITYKGLKKPLIIYLNGYLYKKPKAPKGLSIK